MISNYVIIIIMIVPTDYQRLKSEDCDDDHDGDDDDHDGDIDHHSHVIVTKLRTVANKQWHYQR